MKENDTDYNNVIADEELKETIGLFMHIKNLKNTPVAQVFEVGIYKFLIQFAIGIALVVGAYYIIVDRIDDNETGISINLLYGVETRDITNAHIDKTSGEPLTELEMTLAVEGLEEDLEELEFETDLNTEGRILHNTAMAVQELQNTVIIGKLEEILGNR